MKTKSECTHDWVEWQEVIHGMSSTVFLKRKCKLCDKQQSKTENVADIVFERDTLWNDDSPSQLVEIPTSNIIGGVSIILSK